MTLLDDGWFDWTLRDPGPPDRILSALRTPVSVYVCHSQEGTYAYPGGWIVLRAPQYHPTAWHWTKLRDGRVTQHYPIWAHLQHGHAANVLGPGGEAEGYHYEPLTPLQVAADLRIIADINEWHVRHGRAPLTRDPEPRPQGTKRGLVEHREMAPARNTTQCPSERYAPLWAALEDELSAEDKARLDRLERLVAGYGYGRKEDGTVDLFGEEALQAADYNGSSLFLGLGDTQAKLIDHEATPHEIDGEVLRAGSVVRIESP